MQAALRKADEEVWQHLPSRSPWMRMTHAMPLLLQMKLISRCVSTYGGGIHNFSCKNFWDQGSICWIWFFHESQNQGGVGERPPDTHPFWVTMDLVDTVPTMAIFSRPYQFCILQPTSSILRTLPRKAAPYERSLGTQCQESNESPPVTEPIIFLLLLWHMTPNLVS